jgi:acetyltransferase
MLPPLNDALAHALVHDARRRAALPDVADAPDASADALAALLVRLSTLAGLLPWITTLTLDVLPAAAAGREGADGTPGAAVMTVSVTDAAADPARTLQPYYRHMAIHPYPVELVERITLRDGTPLTLRPIRPEDGALEREFVDRLTPRTRFFRFFHQLAQLTPPMIARFTQVDYDRELALVAVAGPAAMPGAGHPAIVGVARYIADPDGESAEFAVVVDDAWQGRGIARLLMERLIEAARRRGYRCLEGIVLRDNAAMLGFAAALGFTVAQDPSAADQRIVRLTLQSPRTR